MLKASIGPKNERWAIYLVWGLLVVAVGFQSGCQSSGPKPGVAPAEDLSGNAQRLHEGDIIRITFENATNLNTTQTIPMDGLIAMPLIGQVKAAGETTVFLEALLTALYESQIKTPEIRVARIASGATYSIGGAVMKPGKLPLDRPLTVLEAIMEAGGVNPGRAKLSEVIVLRIENDRRVKYRVNLKNALKGKEPELFYLKPFDIIYVPEKTFNF